MHIHPVALRAIQWKFGEVKLTKMEEVKLASDFVKMVTGTDSTWVPTGGFTVSAHPSPMTVSITAVKPPTSIIDGILRVLKSGKLKPETVYRYFQRSGWKGSEISVRKAMYRGVGDGLLIRVGDGRYELAPSRRMP